MLFLHDRQCELQWTNKDFLPSWVTNALGIGECMPSKDFSDE